jgi:hypothetical protein
MINFADWKAHWVTVPPQVDGATEVVSICRLRWSHCWLPRSRSLCKTLLANEFDPDAAEERLPKTYPAPTLTLFLEKLPLKVIFSGYNMNCWPSKIIGRRDIHAGGRWTSYAVPSSPLCVRGFSAMVLFGARRMRNKKGA